MSTSCCVSSVPHPHGSFEVLPKAINAWQEPLTFQIPPSPSGRPWRRVVDTALASPLDIVPEDDAPTVPLDMPYPLASFSLIVLISEA